MTKNLINHLEDTDIDLVWDLAEKKALSECQPPQEPFDEERSEKDIIEAVEQGAVIGIEDHNFGYASMLLEIARAIDRYEIEWDEVFSMIEKYKNKWLKGENI